MILPRKPLAVVFDLDGTLIDSEMLVREAHLAACAGLGYTMSDTQFLSLVGLHREANDKQLKAMFGEDFPLEAFVAASRAQVGDRVAVLKPGVLKLLDTLDQLGLPYGIATSSRRPWVDRHLVAHGLTHRFSAVVTRVDCIEGKPHPEPYLKTAAALGVATEQVVALEDSHAGVRSAYSAGCMTVMVPDLLPADEEMRAKTLQIANSLHDVVDLLDGQSAVLTELSYARVGADRCAGRRD